MELGIKAKDLAGMVGVTRSAVSQWENGMTKMIQSEHIMKIAKALSVTPEWLLTGKQSLSPNRRRGAYSAQEISSSTYGAEDIDLPARPVDPRLAQILTYIEVWWSGAGDEEKAWAEDMMRERWPGFDRWGKQARRISSKRSDSGS